MDRRWRRWTSPLAWSLLAVSAAQVALAIAQRLAVDSSAIVPGLPASLSLVLLGAVVLRVAANPTAADRPALGVLSAVVLAGAAALEVGNAVYEWSNGSQVLAWRWLVLGLVPVISAVGAVLVTLVWTGRGSTNQGADRGGVPAAGELAPERQPSWSPTQAVGASWTRAGDAATGAPAAGSSGSGWGLPSAEPPAATAPPLDNPAESGIARAVPGVPTAADWAAEQPQSDSPEPPAGADS